MFWRCDPVLGCGSAPVAAFEVAELPAGGVGGERGDLVPVDVMRSCAPGCGFSARMMTRIPGGQPVRSDQVGDLGDASVLPDVITGVLRR